MNGIARSSIRTVKVRRAVRIRERALTLCQNYTKARQALARGVD